MPRLPFSLARRPNSEKDVDHHAVAVAALRPCLDRRRRRRRRLRAAGWRERRLAALAGVRVEAVDGDVEDARAQVGVDELRGQLEAIGERVIAGMAPWADSSCRFPGVVGCCRRCSRPSSGRSRAGSGCLIGGRRRSFDDGLLRLVVAAGRGGQLELKIIQRRDRRHSHRRAGQGQRRRLVRAGQVKGRRA